MMQLDAKQPEAVAEARDSILRSGGLLAAPLGSAHGVMSKGQNHVTLTSKSIIYGTPLWLFKELDSEFHFETDVCSIPELALCARYYTPEQDGLAQEWRGVCWMNPPYGKEIGKWIRKAYESSLDGATVVSLLPARVDTKWFHDLVWNKAEIRYPRGRLTFRGAVSVSTRKRWQAPFACLIAIHRPPSASAPNEKLRGGGSDAPASRGTLPPSSPASGSPSHVQIAPRAASGTLRGGRSSNPKAESQTL